MSRLICVESTDHRVTWVNPDHVVRVEYGPSHTYIDLQLISGSVRAVFDTVAEVHDVLGKLIYRSTEE